MAKEVVKAEKRFGADFNEETFVKTNPRVIANQGKIDVTNNRFVGAMEAGDLPAVKKLIEDCGIADPDYRV